MKLSEFDIPITHISTMHLPNQLPSFRIEGYMASKSHHDSINEFIESKQRFFQMNTPPSINNSRTVKQ